MSVEKCFWHKFPYVMCSCLSTLGIGVSLCGHPHYKHLEHDFTSPVIYKAQLILHRLKCHFVTMPILSLMNHRIYLYKHFMKYHST